MVAVGILVITTLFGIGILLSPKKPSEQKKITLIEAEGPIETLEIKKVEEIIIR
jgi:hypothetical protein